MYVIYLLQVNENEKQKYYHDNHWCSTFNDSFIMKINGKQKCGVNRQIKKCFLNLVTIAKDEKSNNSLSPKLFAV